VVCNGNKLLVGDVVTCVDSVEYECIRTIFADEELLIPAGVTCDDSSAVRVTDDRNELVSFCTGYALGVPCGP
jgi:hypothetical protein